MPQFQCPHCHTIIECVRFIEETSGWQEGSDDLELDNNGRIDTCNREYGDSDVTNTEHDRYECPECDEEIELSEIIINNDEEEPQIIPEIKKVIKEEAETEKDKKSRLEKMYNDLTPNQIITRAVDRICNRTVQAVHVISSRHNCDLIMQNIKWCKKCKTEYLITEKEYSNRLKTTCPKCNQEN
jgi:hypothetical protein